MAKETAEQKLLKIIENAEGSSQEQTAVAAPPADVAQQIAASVRGPSFSAPAIPPIFSMVMDLFSGKLSLPQEKPSFGLREGNTILLIVILIILAFYITDFISGMKHANRDVFFPVESVQQDADIDVIPHMREVADYVAMISRRNIFQPYEKKVAIAEDTSIPLTMKRITEQVKNYKLVGISWLDTPESASALIENTESGITYFLRQGETINNVSIKEIYADTVVLGYEGEETEFRLSQ